MFVSLLLKLRSKTPVRLTAADGVYAHAAVLQAISAVNPTAGRELHDGYHGKPLSLAIVAAGHYSATVRVALMADHALDYAYSLVEALTVAPKLRINSYIFTVDSSDLADTRWGGVATWRDLNANDAQRITMRFVTPTAITRDRDGGGRYSLLYPEPAAVFGGLARRWCALGGPALPANLNDVLVGGGCVIAKHRLQTVQFKTRRRTQIGFTGYAVYDCCAVEPEQRQAITSLAQLARFSGIGYQTARGMGAAQVELA